MKKKFVFIALLALSLFPGRGFADAGSTGWVIFRKVMPVQFMSIAATVPDHSTIIGTLYNPAIGGGMDHGELFLLSEEGFADDHLGAMLFSCHTGRWTFTLGGTYYDAGSGELNWIANGTLMSRTVVFERDMMGLFSAGCRVSDAVSAGITVKGAQSELAETADATAYAADAGTVITPAKNLWLSMAIQNVGKSTAFVAKEDPLPTAAYLGSAYVIGDGNAYVIPSAAVTCYLNEQRQAADAGIEVGYGRLSFSGGYHFDSDESSLQMGVEISAGAFVVGYSFLPGNYLDAVHRLEFVYRYGAGSGDTARATATPRRMLAWNNK